MVRRKVSKKRVSRKKVSKRRVSRKKKSKKRVSRKKKSKRRVRRRSIRKQRGGGVEKHSNNRYYNSDGKEVYETDKKGHYTQQRPSAAVNLYNQRRKEVADGPVRPQEEVADGPVRPQEVRMGTSWNV